MGDAGPNVIVADKKEPSRAAMRRHPFKAGIQNLAIGDAKLRRARSAEPAFVMRGIDIGREPADAAPHRRAQVAGLQPDDRIHVFCQHQTLRRAKGAGLRRA